MLKIENIFKRALHGRKQKRKTREILINLNLAVEDQIC